MPHSLIAHSTCMMTSGGWLSAGLLTNNPELLGTDRHGKLVMRRAEIEPLTNTSDRVAVLGTDGGFGIFPQSAIVLRNDGAPIRIADVVESECLDEYWFEMVISGPNGSGGNGAAIDTFYRCLERAWHLTIGKRLLFRCRSRDVLEWQNLKRFGCFRFQKAMNEVFCAVDSERMRHLTNFSWPEIVCELVTALWHNSENEQEEFDIRANGACLWYLAALERMGANLEVSYDSLQHSIVAKVGKCEQHKGPIRPCRCAFYMPQPELLIRLEWEEVSWKPMAGGLLLAAA